VSYARISRAPTARPHVLSAILAAALTRWRVQHRLACLCNPCASDEEPVRQALPTAQVTHRGSPMVASCSMLVIVAPKLGRRLASCHTALFYPPPAKRDVRLSTHPAFQWPALLCGQPCPSRTLPHSRQAACHPSPCREVSLSALVGRDSHKYYGGSVTLGFAPCRRSRHAVSLNVRARCRCPVRFVIVPVAHRSAHGRYRPRLHRGRHRQ